MKSANKWKLFGCVCGVAAGLWILFAGIAFLLIRSFHLEEVSNESVVWASSIGIYGDWLTVWSEKAVWVRYLLESGMVFLGILVIALLMLWFEVKGLRNRADLTAADDRYFAEEVIRITKVHVLNLEDNLEELKNAKDAYALRNGEKRMMEETVAANRDLEAFLVRYRKKK